MNNLQVPTVMRGRSRSNSVGEVSLDSLKLSFSCSDLLSLDSSPNSASGTTTNSPQFEDVLSPDLLSSLASSTSVGSATKKKKKPKISLPALNLLPNKLRFGKHKDRHPTYPMSGIHSLPLLEKKAKTARPSDLALWGMPLRSRSNSVVSGNSRMKVLHCSNYSTLDEDDEAFVASPISIVISSSGEEVSRDTVDGGIVGGNLNSEAYRKFLGKSFEQVCVCVCV